MHRRLGHKLFAGIIMVYVDVSVCNDDVIFSLKCVFHLAVSRKQGERFLFISRIYRIKNLWHGGILKGIQAIIKRF